MKWCVWMAALQTLRQPQLMLRGLLLLAVLLLPAIAGAQSRVFYDGAEGTGSAWGVNKCTAVTVAADGGAPVAGSRMWRCGWNGTLDWTNPDKLRDMAADFSYNREFLVRFRRRYDANADWTAGSKEFRVSFAGSGEIFGACQREHGATRATMLIAGNSIATYWGGGPLCGQGWSEIAVYRRDAINGAGGITRVWQDGVLLREWTGNTGGHGGGFNLPSNWSSNPGWEHDALNYIYFDEAEAYADTATGTAITGRLDNNTARASGAPPPPPPPPTPTPCEGTWVESLSAPTPLVCDATQVQTRTLTRTWVTSREPTNGGMACPANPPPTTVTESCVFVPPPPPPPPPVPTIVGRFASQATYSSGGVSGVRVTLRVSAAQAMPAVGRAVSLRVPLANGDHEDRAGTVRSTRLNAYAGGDGQIVVELPGMSAIGLRFSLP